MAQSVEHILGKDEGVSSILTSSSKTAGRFSLPAVFMSESFLFLFP